ncbi:nicotinamide riboside transporter PnuC [Flavicella sediminum]|uniref:nicotinamide riboside transporter PnuC n=1 Tax=Flavicella sediminum TaxID=2585141 RepID=UPI00111C9FA9|nr:nicotinamide riboside transporter PnuC [Flavicella sediminum]
MFEINTFLEIASVLLGLIYLVLLIQEKKACWFYGIAGSLLSIFLFYRIHLYSEAILYSYYVFIGIYGYRLWDKSEKDNEKLKITTRGISFHTYIILTAIFLGAILGFCFENYTDAENAYLDAGTTIFSFLASYLEAQKILSAWLFWIVINGVTIYLYSQKSLDWYAGLTFIYTAASFIGLFKWRKIYLEENKLTKSFA